MIVEICAASRVSKKEIGRCFKLIIKSLETSLEQITSADFMVSFIAFLTNLYKTTFCLHGIAS